MEGGGSKEAMLSAGRASKVPRGESTNPQDVKNRANTLLKEMCTLAHKWKAEEGVMDSTFLIIASVPDGRGGQTLCFESKNLSAWTQEHAHKLVDEAQGGKWKQYQSRQEREDEAKNSREMFPSYGKAVKALNLKKVRSLLVRLGYDLMRKEIKEGKVPQHMQSMLGNGKNRAQISKYILPYLQKEVVPGLEDRNDEDGDSDSDGTLSSARNKRGAGGKFVAKSGVVGEEEANHCMNFGLWKEELQDEEEDHEDGDVCIRLEYLVFQDAGCFKIANSSYRDALVALRLLLEFRQQG